MANVNRVMLLGRLTRDPELRHTGSGSAVCEFGLAINRAWKDKGGESREETCFVDCSAWGRTGEVVHEYMTKGRELFVEGRLQFDSWETPDGQKRSKLRVVAENVQFVGGRDAAGGGGGGSQPSYTDSDRGAASEGYGDVPF